MKDLIKSQYQNMIIALVYTAIASLVYGIWTYKLWELWYVTFIVVAIILIIAGIISYFWIKSEFMKEKENLS